MFNLESSFKRRSDRYNIYQPQRYALYAVGKWMGILGSALLLFSLTIKWYFLLNDKSNSLPNLIVWGLISLSILIFVVGALFIVGLHWWVEKVQKLSLDNNNFDKSFKKENQFKRFRRSSWFSWNKKKKDYTIETVVENDHCISREKDYKGNSYNTSPESFTEASTSSFASTKKLMRSNSKFGTLTCLPIIDELSIKNQAKNVDLNQTQESFQNSFQNNSTNIQVTFVELNQQKNEISSAKKEYKKENSKAMRGQKLSNGSIDKVFLNQATCQNKTQSNSLLPPSSQIVNNNQLNEKVNVAENFVDLSDETKNN